MALEMCPECFKQISSTARFCPHCGYTQQFAKPRKLNPYTLRTGFILLAIFLFIIIIISWKGYNALLYNARTDFKEDYQKSNTRIDESSINDEWYKGGTLHDVSIKYWESASYKNKLATCADFLHAIDSTITYDELKKKAKKLTRQINKTFYKQEITDDATVREIAVLCLGVDLPNNEEDTTEKYNFKILDIRTSGTVKMTIYMQTPEQLTEPELEEIAINLRNENSTYDKLFIFYYLPDMELNGGAWASTHFNKELEIKIYGVDKSIEAKVKNAKQSSGELIGKWYDKTPGIEHSIIISKIGSKYILKRAFRDGSVMEKDLKFSLSNGKMKFVYESDVGEYLLIEKNGQLGQYDNQGLIDKCDKIK